MMAFPQKRSRGEHGAFPLSVRTRRRLLSALLELADDGNVPAMEALARLSFETEISTAMKQDAANKQEDERL